MQPVFIDQIGFVEKEDVSIHHLGATHFAFQDLIIEVFSVDQGDDRIEARLVAQLTTQKGHGDWQGVGQAGGLHHQIIHWLWTLQDSINRVQQLAIDGAADASVAQLHHVLPGADHQVVVNADFAEFIHQNGRFDAVLVGEDVVEKGGLSGTEEAGQDRHRNTAGWHCCAAGRCGHGCGG